MRDKALRRRCAQLVAEIDLSPPFDEYELCRRVGEHRGRPITLTPLPLPEKAPCGIMVATDSTDYVFFQAETSPLHQMHIVGHEVGHLMAGHRRPLVLDEDAVKILLPSLASQAVRMMLGRTRFDAVEEREAELIASLISRAANAPDAGPRWDAPPAVAEDFARLGDALEHVREGRRRG